MRIGQTEASTAQLFSKGAVLLAQVLYGCLLLAGEPAGHGRDEDLPGLEDRAHREIVGNGSSDRQLSTQRGSGLNRRRFGSIEFRDLTRGIISYPLESFTVGHVLRLSDLDAEFFCLGCGVGYRLSSERCSCGAGPTTSRIELETGLARSIGGTPPAPPAPTLGATPTTYGPEDVKAIRDSLSEAGVPFIVADASGMLLEPDASPADVVYAPSDVLDSLVRRYHPGEPVLVVDATMDPESSVLLAEYGSPGEAQVAVGLLESAGIPYEFERFTAQFGLLEGDLARTHIYVRRSDLDRARDVISPRASDSFEIGWSSDDERAMRAARLQRRFRIARVLMVMLATYDLVFAGFTLSGAPMNAVVPAVWGIALIALAAWSHREPRVSFLLGFLVVAASAIWSMVIRDTLFVLPGLLPLLATYFAFEAATKLRAEERT